MRNNEWMFSDNARMWKNIGINSKIIVRVEEWMFSEKQYKERKYLLILR